MKTTLYKAKKVKRRKKHGFLRRMKTKSGRNTMRRRRAKKRTRLSV